MSTKKSRLKRQPQIDTAPDIEDDNDENIYSAKIHAPIVWGDKPAGFVIQDIAESQFEEVAELIRQCYLPNDLLCRNSNILDEFESVHDIINAMMFVVKDRYSICSVEEETKKLAGILILRVVNKSDYGKVYSRIKLTQGEAYNKIRKAFNYLNRKTDLFEKFECTSYLRCYMLAVHDDFRGKGIGLQLLRAAVHVARSLKTPCIMGIFDTNCEQKKARKIGLEVVNEIYYVDWVEKGEIIFSDPGAGNYTLALMAGQVPPLTKLSKRDLPGPSVY